MRILTVFFLLFFGVKWLNFGQLKPIPVGTWRSHFNYEKGRNLAIVGSKIYFAAENGLFLNDLSENKTTIIDETFGIGNLSIASLEFHQPTNTLLTAHNNGDINLIQLDQTGEIQEITNIPFIKNSSTILSLKQAKEINFLGNRAILATDFGLVQIDLLKKNIIEIDKNLGVAGAELAIFSATVLNDKIFVVSNEELLVANINSNLQNFESWQRFKLPISSESQKVQLLSANNSVFILIAGLGVFEFAENIFKRILVFTEKEFSATLDASNMYIAVKNRLLTLSLITKAVSEIKENLIHIPKEIKIIAGKFWLADGLNGLVSNLDGTFKKYNPSPSPGLVNTRNDSIVVDQLGLIYTKLAVGAGLQVADKNGKKRVFLSIPLLQNNSRNSSTVNALAVDKNNTVYIALAGGIVALNSIPEILDATNLNNFISTPVIDGVRTLANEIVTAIAVDGGNNKWVGTESALYFFNEDLSKIAEKFTTSNAPLPSSTINFLNLEGQSGELFVYTPNGIVSYRTGSSEGSENQSDEVLVFPNPVLPQFDGLVGISGLVANAEVKIVDMAGRLVFQTIANGGTASWDLTTKNGQRANAGVYFIFSSNELGKEKLVTKLAVIN